MADIYFSIWLGIHHVVISKWLTEMVLKISQNFLSEARLKICHPCWPRIVHQLLHRMLISREGNKVDLCTSADACTKVHRRISVTNTSNLAKSMDKSYNYSVI